MYESDIDIVSSVVMSAHNGCMFVHHHDSSAATYPKEIHLGVEPRFFAKVPNRGG